MSLLNTINAAGLAAVHAAKSETVRYTTETAEISELLAQPTKPVNHAEPTGRMIDCKELDWIVQVDELQLNEVPFLPTSGHHVVWTLGNQVRVYEVLERDRDQVFEYRDSGHTQFRIFTKLIELQDT